MNLQTGRPTQSSHRANDPLAASKFVESYYPALNTSRNTVASYYTPTYAFGSGSMPAIVYNGEIIQDAASMQAKFLNNIPASRYEVQNYDCQIVNDHYVADGTQGGNYDSGKNMTILITVSGYVKYGEERDTPTRGFSESFVLVPNPLAVGGGGKKAAKEWLIQSQNFRIVV